MDSLTSIINPQHIRRITDTSCPVNLSLAAAPRGHYFFHFFRFIIKNSHHMNKSKPLQHVRVSSRHVSWLTSCRSGSHTCVFSLKCDDDVKDFFNKTPSSCVTPYRPSHDSYNSHLFQRRPGQTLMINWRLHASRWSALTGKLSLKNMDDKSVYLHVLGCSFPP